MQFSKKTSRTAATVLVAAVLSVSGGVTVAGTRPQVASANSASSADETTGTTTTETPAKPETAAPAKATKKDITADADQGPGEQDVRPATERAAKSLSRVQVVRGSLFSAGEAPVNLNGDDHTRSAPVASYTSVTPMEPRKFQKHDIITIVVREDSSNASTGQAQSEKKQDMNFSLDEMLKLSLANLAVSSSGGGATTPKVKFSFDNNRQNTANQQRTDSTTLRISATVVDVKPNGNLVIEAIKQIVMDKEVQDYSLSGICRSEDIAVDNTVLSTQLADLKLKKSTTGEVRDGTRRGWLNSLIDKFNPF